MYYEQLLFDRTVIKVKYSHILTFDSFVRLWKRKEQTLMKLSTSSYNCHVTPYGGNIIWTELMLGAFLYGH